MKITVITTITSHSACYYLRYKSIFELLRKRGDIHYREVTRRFPFNIFNRISIPRDTDVIFMQRCIEDKNMEKVFNFAEKNNIPIIYETDDLLTHARRREGVSNGASRVIPMLKRAAGIIVSTHQLKEYFKEYNSNIFVFPNLIDSLVWSLKEDKKSYNKRKINICCIGTSLLPENFQFVLPAIKYISDKYKRDVVFNLWGNWKYIPKDIKSMKNVKMFSRFIRYKRYCRLLENAGFHFALVPLIETSFNNCKSNIKFLEYSIAGIPGIYSNIEPYKKIKNGETGILVENNADTWINAIVTLIGDEEKRRQLAKNAYNFVKERYLLTEDSCKGYLDFLLKCHTMYGADNS